MKEQIQKLEADTYAVMTTNRWGVRWDNRLGYHVLECAELVEAHRKKRGDVNEEAGDSLITFLALLQSCGVDFERALAAAVKKIELLAELPGKAE
jgi:NTP pyrophosphatase (non-canonical NTP hydrolase)